MFFMKKKKNSFLNTTLFIIYLQKSRHVGLALKNTLRQKHNEKYSPSLSSECCSPSVDSKFIREHQFHFDSAPLPLNTDWSNEVRETITERSFIMSTSCIK